MDSLLQQTSFETNDELFSDRDRYSCDELLKLAEIWNGNFVDEEFERLLRLYVNNEDDWKKNMINRVKVWIWK